MIPLPEKIHLKPGQTPDDLSAEDRVKYDAYYAERARRRDPAQAGSAQEALDTVEALNAAHSSSGDAWSQYGYSLSHVYKIAQHEEARIVRDLQRMPSADVAENPACPLSVAAVKTKHHISEFVPAVVPEGEISKGKIG